LIALDLKCCVHQLTGSGGLEIWIPVKD
jgi:hypothetical protein